MTFLMRFASKRDIAHSAIADELRTCGFCVVDLSRVGAGCPDLLVSKFNVWVPVELKTLKYIPKLAKTRVKSPKEQRSQAQIDWHGNAKGPIITAYTASEIRYEFSLLIKRREGYAL